MLGVYCEQRITVQFKIMSMNHRVVEHCWHPCARSPTIISTFQSSYNFRSTGEKVSVSKKVTVWGVLNRNHELNCDTSSGNTGYFLRISRQNKWQRRSQLETHPVLQSSPAICASGENLGSDLKWKQEKSWRVPNAHLNDIFDKPQMWRFDIAPWKCRNHVVNLMCIKKSISGTIYWRTCSVISYQTSSILLISQSEEQH